MTFALIPAAGRSSRMGRPKLLLPVGGRTVLEHVIAALRTAGIGRVLVVVGPHVPTLAETAEAAGAVVLRLEESTPDMRATVERGLAWAEANWRPRPDDDWLLVPADHPTLEADVIRRLLAARADNPACSIAVPTFAGRRGHPTLIAWRHVGGIRQLPPDTGLNAYLRRFPAETCEVPAAGESVLFDLDTPADYERLLTASGQGEHPERPV